MAPAVSVIVPVYNQGCALAACFAALERQTSRAFEVIAVDNGSTDANPCWSTFPLTWISEQTPGSYAARNAGIRAARSEVLAFTDADCVPAPDWIARGLEAVHALPGPGFVGGRVDLSYQDPSHLTSAELFERVSDVSQAESIRRLGFARTANLWTTQATLREVGLFHDRLFSGGDVEWGQRVSQRLTGMYADAVRVSHPARRTLLVLCRRSMRVTGGLYQLLKSSQRVRGSWDRPLYPDDCLVTIRDRVRVAAVSRIVAMAQWGELVRLQLGGTPRRI